MVTKKKPVKPPVKRVVVKAPAKKKPVKPAPKPAPKPKPTPKPKPPVEDISEEDIPTTPPELDEDVPAEVDDAAVEGEVPAETPVEEPAEKIDKEQVLTFVEYLIDRLTFRRVGLIALLTVIGLILYAVWENRTDLVNRIIQPDPVAVSPEVPVWDLSDTSKAMLQTLAKDTAVTFVAVTDVDLKKNRRGIRYYFIDSPAIRLEAPTIRALGLPQAVFDYDPKNTAQMVAVLSNEFRCDPFIDTIYFRYAPDIAPQVPVICRIAIPPFVGQFVGFLTVGLERQVTSNELNTIRLEVSRIAVEIYLNDVIKKPATP